MKEYRPRPVMIVEDDPMIMKAMVEAFDLFGRETIAADNGSKAIETLKQLRDHEYPCCIILDLMMPKMTGEEFIFHIQALGKVDLDSIPIIVSSASTKVVSMNEPRVRLKLKKPVELQVIESISREFF